MERQRKCFVHENLDEAVYKWYVQQRAEGLPVRGVDIQNAAQHLANHLGIQDFRWSDGGLWRFRKQHGLGNRSITGKLLSADANAVDPFITKLHELMEKEGLHEFQVNNADETGLFWHALPRNTQTFKDISSPSGHKVMKKRLSMLVCGNTDGSHRLKPVIVGKSNRPRAIKDIMNRLPVEYYGAPSAWFSQDIVEEWFQ